jgi:hypothetical protein
MILILACAVGLAMLAATGTDVRRLSTIELRAGWLVWVAITTQVVVLTVFGRFLGNHVGELVHLSTYVTAGIFVIVNLGLPGVWLMGLGGAANLLAITANGGVMPASARAWELAGRGDTTGFANSVPVSDPHLLVLGDVFAIPAGLPLSNVFSIGDVLLVIGLLWLVYRWCHQPLPSADVKGDDVSPGPEPARSSRSR